MIQKPYFLQHQESVFLYSTQQLQPDNSNTNFTIKPSLNFIYSLPKVPSYQKSLFQKVE